MSLFRGVLLFGVAAGLAVASAEAATLPAIKATSTNKVPECATPGRLLGYLKSRNPALDSRFEAAATEYMRHGEELGLRWDYAFFQMIVETASLSFKRGNGSFGDVKPNQNNFAGLGATGGGEPGESFRDISTGVKAHLQHVLMYSGARVDNPVAERTRKVQEWGVLTSWQKGLKGPMTFTDLTRKWSPKDNGYSNDIENVGAKFYSDFCSKADPRPELVQEARKGRGTSVASASEAPAAPKVSGADLAKKAIERGQAEGANTRAGLGAQAMAAAGLPPAAPTAPVSEATSPAARLNVLNAPKADEPAKATVPFVQASAAAAAAVTAKPAPATAAKCRVWTASYGGHKSVIIKAIADQHINYTVLDVNEGAEKREAEAYIAAYAKGGQLVGEFASQPQALDKAFDLCPEG